MSVGKEGPDRADSRSLGSGARFGCDHTPDPSPGEHRRRPRPGGGERGRLRRVARPDRRESVVHAPPDDGEIGWPRRATTRGPAFAGGFQQVVQAPNEHTLERGRTMSAVPPRPPTSECEAEHLYLALANPRNSRINSPAGSARTFSASRYRSAPACTTSSRSSPSVSTADRIDRVNRGASDRFTSNP